MWVLRREFWVSYFVWLVHLPPLLIPVFTAELCGFLPLVPLVICIGTESGFCFPSSLHTFVSPATGSCKGKSWFFTLHFLWFAATQGRPLQAVVLSPHCFAFSLVCGFWFPPPFFVVFLFLWLLWSAQRAADSPWKTQQTFHTNHLLAFAILSCVHFYWG